MPQWAMIISFLKNYWPEVIMAGLLIWIGWMKIDLADAHAELAQQKAHIEMLEAANSSFKAASDNQNAHIKDLASAAAARALNAASALANADKTIKISDSRISALLSSPDQGNDCQNADRLLIGAIKEFSR